MDPIYQGRYSVIDFRHPNVKIESNKGRASWVRGQLQDCAQGGNGALHTRRQYARRCDGGGRPRERETCYREGATDELEVEEDQKLRRSIRSKKRSKRYESD